MLIRFQYFRSTQPKGEGPLLRIFCCLALMLASLPAWSAVGGRITGVITERTGAVVPNAQVALVDHATGITHLVQTDSKGAFTFADLPVSVYDLKVQHPGFQSYIRNGINLDANGVVAVNATLDIGHVAQAVTVQANSVQTDTVSTQLGQVISARQMTTVPLDGRSYTDLLALQPGVSPVSSGVTSFQGLSTAGQLSINGGREASNAFMVNGALVEEGNANSAGLVPNLDSIAEFRILTSSADAEYGEFSGGQVNVITKSGTNALHGDVFEFLRNTDLDARNFYTSSRGKYIQNQFGGTLGGPILKSKLFFFVDYQGTRQDIGQSPGNIFVPTDAMRGGDFASVASKLNGKVQGAYWAGYLAQRLGYPVSAGELYYAPNCTSAQVCVFPNAIIPASAISPISTNLLQYIPVQNTANGFQTSAFNFLNNDNEGAVHIDYTLGNHAISGYYYQEGYAQTQPYGSGNLPGFNVAATQGTKLITLSDVDTYGSRAVNEARISYYRLTPTMTPTGNLGESPAQLGFPSGPDALIPQNLQFNGVPYMQLNNYSFGDSLDITPVWAHNTYTALDNFTLTKGNHTIKFGAMGALAQINYHLSAFNNGFFAYYGQETGIDFADFLLGAPSAFYQGVEAPLYSRDKYFGVYAEDSWRVNDQLVVNYGLREDVPAPWSEAKGELETFVPGEQSVVFPGAPKGYVFPGDPGIPKTLAPTRYVNLAPRFGIAFAPHASSGFLSSLLGKPGDTSIRSAFGIYYTSIENIASVNEIGSAPYGLFWVSPTPPLLGAPYLNRATGQSYGQHFPVNIPEPPTAQDPNTTVNWSQFLPISATGYYYKNRTPYTEQYNLSIQRQAGAHSVVTAAYVGSQGHSLLNNVNANPGIPALCLSVSQQDEVASGSPTCRPFGENGVYTAANGTIINSTRGPLGANFTSVNYHMNSGYSNYNAAELSWRYSSPQLDFLASYTWSKSMDDGSGFNDNTNPYDSSLSYGLSAFNVPQNFVTSYAYHLPFGELHGPARLTNGWVLSGIARFASGVPVTLLETDDGSLEGTSGGGIGNGTDLPNYEAGNLRRGSDPRACLTNPACSPYFNTKSFSSEVLGQVGDSKPRFFSGPGINNFDTALLKDTEINERFRVQARFELFNTFNHAQFLTPSGNIDSSSFGYVTSAADPRIGQVALKLLF